MSSSKDHPWLRQFAVAIVERKKHFLFIEEVNMQTKQVTGVDHRQYPCAQTPRIDVPTDSIVAVLGPSPELGTVFGVKTLRYRRQIDSPNWAAVHIWRKMKKSEWNLIEEATVAVSRKLRKMGVTINWPIELHIKEAEGKYAGTYRTVYKLDDNEEPLPDIITFFPPAIEEQKAIQFLMAHEFGHGIFWRHMKKKDRSAWVKMYIKYVELSRVQMGHIDAVKKAVDKERPASLSEIYGLFDADDVEMQTAVEAIIGHIMKHFNLNKNYLDCLLANEESISAMFPTHPLDVGGLKEMVTEYATKSPEECFCECLAVHVCGMKLPKDIEALLLKSL